MAGEWTDLPYETAAGHVSPPLEPGDQFVGALSGLIYTIIDEHTASRNDGRDTSPWYYKNTMRICRNGGAAWNTITRTRLRDLGLEPGAVFRDDRNQERRLLQVSRSRMFLVGFTDHRSEPRWLTGGLWVTAIKSGGRVVNGVLVPDVSEVICNVCHRPLGEYSDGTTPRQVLGQCCSGTRETWSHARMVRMAEAANVPVDVENYDDDEEYDDEEYD